MAQTDLPQSYRPLSLADGIRSSMQRDPGKIAMSDPTSTCTYAQLVERMDLISSALISGLALEQSDHIAIVALNCVEYIELIAGASQVGIAVATVNPRLTNAEIQLICDDAHARVLFVDAANEEQVRDCSFAHIDEIIVFGEHFDAWLTNAKPMIEAPRVDEWLPFTIPYTSGTTGRPKGVLVSSRSRMLTCYGMAVEYGCYSPDDRFLAVAPLCHGAGMVFPLATIFFGGYAQIMPKFEPEKLLAQLASDQITGVFMVPTHFHQLFALEKSYLDLHRPQHLKTIISNAAPLPQATKERVISYFGEGLLHETYGSTEAGIVTNLRPNDQMRKRSCVGLPFTSTSVSIRNEQGQECTANEVGELFSQSPYLFNGYWRRDGETQEAFANGWVTVGDLARRDEEGFIYIVDRKKDMIISGGVNIYPREIENVLVEHPALVEVAITGVPDLLWGERLKAWVVTAPEAHITVEDIKTFCQDRLASYKIPRELEQISALPRNASGKVLKTQLREI
jgi:acyl-CoA synthetase (AMP-forming)/AMP-acid ligase II